MNPKILEHALDEATPETDEAFERQVTLGDYLESLSPGHKKDWIKKRNSDLLESPWPIVAHLLEMMWETEILKRQIQETLCPQTQA